jgi:protein-disulfide isomerase
MTPSRSISLALALVAVVLSGCSKDPAPAAPAAPAAALVGGEDPSTPVARYGSRTITLKEADAQISAQLKQLDKQRLEARQAAAEQVAIQALVRDEATKAGQSEEAFLKANIDDKLPAPPEDQIKKVFDENKSKMPPGSTLASMREQIIAFLGQDARRKQALQVFGELKQKAGFQLLLEAPRVVVEAKGPSRGPAEAKVTIVEFSDFECPFCGRAEESVTQVMERYPGKVRVVYRHFPLSFHPHAQKAAEAAACADAQGKFWEMHKQLFANQQKLGLQELKVHAQTAGLDAAKFSACLDGSATKAQVDADQKAGAEIGVSGTPAFFINGKMLSGAQPFEEFQKIIDAELAKGT